jgi:membrane associated rhomboid family serine protease
MRRYRMGVQNGVVTLILVSVAAFLFSRALPQLRVSQWIVSNQLHAGRNGLAQAFLHWDAVTALFALIPAAVVQIGWVWQVVTYLFLHGSFLHIFFNMYALFLFGRPLESRWGTREFLLYYFFTGIMAGACTLLWNLFSHPFVPTIGASGAIFGLVLAFGLEFPDAVLLLFFFIPLRAKYAVFVFGGIELVMILTGSMQGIGHFTHLAGIAFGYLYYIGRIKNRYYGQRVRRGKSVGRRRKKTSSRRPSRRPSRLPGWKVERVLAQAESLRIKIAAGSDLSQSEEKFLGTLRDSFKRSGGRMCAPDEFDPKAEDCRRCDDLLACLYRYVLEIK